MKNKSNKENRASLERRLSLKYSSAGPKAKHRMSIPMRRESVGAFSEIQHKNVDPSYELR